MSKKIPTLILSLILAAAPTAAASAATPIEGKWTNPKRSVVIHMSPCGDAICGKVISANAKAKADAANGGTPDLIGKNLLSGFKPNGKGGWTGRVFLPKQNMHATGTIQIESANAIVVKGCAIAGLICRDQRWTRVD